MRTWLYGGKFDGEHPLKPVSVQYPFGISASSEHAVCRLFRQALSTCLLDASLKAQEFSDTLTSRTLTSRTRHSGIPSDPAFLALHGALGRRTVSPKKLPPSSL